MRVKFINNCLKFCLLIGFFSCVLPLIVNAANIPKSPRAEAAIKRVEPGLKKSLAAKGLKYGAPVFIRIFKKSNVLEIWLKSDNGKFKHFKNYDICHFSGRLGPKLKEGDQQSPEGFYFVNARRLNPWSRYHLSFNLGYPNQYDRYHGRTGSALMVHGNCVSIGCYAMTDAFIEEIYALTHAALQTGQAFFRVHVFPFKLEDKNLSRYKSNQWYSFWVNLKQGYDYFENNKVPPNVEVLNGRYVFGK